jgi:hypothetical protein
MTRVDVNPRAPRARGHAAQTRERWELAGQQEGNREQGTGNSKAPEVPGAAEVPANISNATPGAAAPGAAQSGIAGDLQERFEAQQKRCEENRLRLIAVAGVLKTSDVSVAKGALKPGETHHVDCVVHINAMVSKGADTDKAPTSKLLTIETIAWLCKRLGATREAVQAALAELAGKAIAGGGEVAEALIAENDELVLTVHRFQKQVIDALPRTPVSGSVKVVGTCEFIEPATGPSAAV